MSSRRRKPRAKTANRGRPGETARSRPTHIEPPRKAHSRATVSVAAAGLVAVSIAVYWSLDGGEVARPGDAASSPEGTLAAPGSLTSPSDSGYIDSAACAGCHQEIWTQFQETGMARSFSAMDADVSAADFEGNNTYYHAASDRQYHMYREGNRFFMKRTQIGPDGQVINEVEKRIQYVLGSGYKARTYLAKNAQGELLQLPVAWYTERGGFWAMNPGYDRPDHDGFSRRVKFDCMFCHNSYFDAGSGGDGFDADPVYGDVLPEGIDCQRCHGPGKPHIEALANGGSDSDIRESIVNPATLSPERSLEVCYQCHLQSTSFRLPYASQRPGRGVLSYRPGQPLADYILHFDHPPGGEYDDKFEIAHAAYRLRKSACFQEGGGSLSCTTCHDPHRHLSKDTAEYIEVCLSCHRQPSLGLPGDADHDPASDCLKCHMPQRRTDDVVHVVMTDHFIRRHQPEQDLLAPRPEIVESPNTGYQGEVALYYPDELPDTPANELDVAVAQVEAGTNLEDGLPRLRRAVDSYQPVSHHYYYELAEANFKAGDLEEAFKWWEETLRRKPDFLPALRNYGKELAKAGRPDRGIEVLRRVLAVREGDPRALYDMALAYFLKGDSAQGMDALRGAISADPENSQAHNLLATQLYATGDVLGAELEFRNAIRWEPRHAVANANLAALLAEQGQLDQSEFYFERAVAFDPDYGKGLLDYGIFLADRRQRFDEAITYLRAAVRIEPGSVPARVGLGYALSQTGDLQGATRELQTALAQDPFNTNAHLYLAGVFERQEELSRAREHYEQAVRLDPIHHLAHYGLGAVLAKQGETTQALQHFATASQSSNPELRQFAIQAAETLKLGLEP